MSIIWLNKDKYPQNQETKPFMWSGKDNNYSRVEISKKFSFDKEITSIRVYFAADTNCLVYCNEKLIADTNIKAYGDFLFKDRLNPVQCLGKKKIDFSKGTKELNFLAHVSMGVCRLYDLSSGFGGFYLKCEINFIDGTSKTVETDKTWLIRLNKGYVDYNNFDQNLDTEVAYPAEEKKIPWKLIDDDAPVSIENEIDFDNEFVVGAKKDKSYTRELKWNYSSYIGIDAECDGEVEVHISILEKEASVGEINAKFLTNKSIRILDMFSTGILKITIKNKSGKTCKIKVHVYHSLLESVEEKKIFTDNKKLNLMFDKCHFAALNCTQNVILDSPKHCEPSASCSGDYSIISLTYGMFTGDYQTAKHILRAYSYTMERNHGANSNSSYALTFITWLWEIYMITGDVQLLKDCLPGVKAVIDEFKTYVGESGIVDKPNNFIFMDWLVVDGYGLFCPPSNLGQSVFTMFYYEALKCSALIYKELGNDRISSRYSRMAKRLKKAINEKLFNKEKGLYCEGLNIPIPEQRMPDIVCNGVPEGNGKIYYRKHANILAVAYGIANKSTSKKIIRKLFGELSECEIQPYFDHYFFKAITKAGLDKKYTMKLIKEWTSRIKPADKGLPEGFYLPQPEYVFDFSHGWACSPYYSFIISASGLEILTPGMKDIKLKPKTLNVKGLKYSISTPYGYITISGDKVTSKPKEVNIVYGN